MNKLEDEPTLDNVVITTVDYLEHLKKIGTLKTAQYEEISNKFWEFKDLIDKTIRRNFH